MRLLILGGTLFLGRELAAQALAKGHELSLFTRGRTNPELFDGAERLRGDRSGDLSALRAGTWDAVIDTSAHLPRHVRASAELLASRVGHYTYVSSISVYREYGSAGAAQGTELASLPDPGADPDAETEVRPETYGALKAASERAVREAMNDRALAVRPGLIVGPHDPSDRFTYWPLRAARGGEILAPAPRSRRVQVIDARDLAAFLLRAAEAGLTGTLDATGPSEPLSFGRVLETCLEAGAADARPTWVHEDWLLEQGVGPWMELPLWVPGTDAAIDISPALAAGLSFRPLAETVRDTLAWASAEKPRERKAGLDPARERELLALWRAREKQAGCTDGES